MVHLVQSQGISAACGAVGYKCPQGSPQCRPPWAGLSPCVPCLSLLNGEPPEPTPCLEEPQSYPAMAWTQKPMEASCALRMCREPGTLGVCLLLWQSIVPETRAGEIWCLLGTSKGLEETPFLSRLLSVFGWCDIEDTAISRGSILLQHALARILRYTTELCAQSRKIPFRNSRRRA